ncbi:MAG TPA: regulatory protein RecX [Cyclobacteriaceae bacterium]|nr:regulatory protein RecX [Cyclobacteriaceae bacterium]
MIRGGYSASGSGKIFSPAEAFIKATRYCAFQERSHYEVRNKLYSFGLHRNEVEEIISRLITDGFLNEERFAKAFAGGKFRMKKWGRNKIAHELELHKITPRCVQKGLNEIDPADYTKTLTRLLKAKLSQSAESNLFKKRDKAARFAIGKGYESELVWSVLKELTGRNDDL